MGVNEWLGELRVAAGGLGRDSRPWPLRIRVPGPYNVGFWVIGSGNFLCGV